MFPWLDVEDSFRFPDPEEADDIGILAAGGNLSPGMLLSAYRQGVFPWYCREEPILWWSPDPCFVLFPQELHVAKRMQRILRQNRFRITFDTAFEEVIGACAAAPRPRQDGTWITGDMLRAYTALHREGYAHSAEAWLDGRLAGGLYGLSLGGLFFGESMFSRRPNASKAAFIVLVRELTARGVELIDSQVHTPHLESLGARDIPRRDYLELLERLLTRPDLVGNWREWRSSRR